MAAAGNITVHSFHVSSCGWRVRLALDYKGIPYAYKAWNLNKGEHLTEEYKKLSPLHLVPSMEIDGAVLTDSLAIMEYLEDRFPEKPLYPKDLVKRAAVRSFVNTIVSGIQPLQNRRVLNSIAAMGGEDARAEWARKWITLGFEALEYVAKDTAGKYCFGDELTMADVTLVPQLGNAHRFKVDMGKFPILQQLEKNLYELELVVFADGTFIDGGTSEFSCDGPLREPFVVFCQGGTHWTHWALALEAVVQTLQQM